jgi:proton-translocating NADH-quinone oxidoreductase chain M
MDTLLLVLLISPLVAIFLTYLPKLSADSGELSQKENNFYLWGIGLINSAFIFLLSSIIWLCYNNHTMYFQGMHVLTWDTFWGISLVFGVDGISILLIQLTTFLIPICFLASMASIKNRVQDYIALFFLIEFLCICSFTFLDLILFYIFFEAVLIPMFVIIGIWGSRERKVRAGYQFFIYTLLGSVFMLFAIVIIWSQTGTTNYFALLTTNFSEELQLWLWLAFFGAFAVKVPMVPFHLWLPEAHVEAPTAGSVLLAGILLKLGTYGFMRYSLPLLPIACLFYMPFIFLLCSLGVIYASLTTIRQVDLKKIIAYSSVAHMGIVMLGLFSITPQGLQGSLILMLGHGVVSGALFLCIGVLYDRYHTRILKYYGGLVQVMPMYAVCFIFFTLANIGFPGLSNFVGEFLCFLAAFERNFFASFLAVSGTLFGVGYSMWLANRLLFGNLRIKYIGAYNDLTLVDYIIFLPFIFLTLLMGLYPKVFLDTAYCSIFGILSVYLPIAPLAF